MQGGVLLTVRSVAFHQFDPENTRMLFLLQTTSALCRFNFFSQKSLMFKEKMQMQITSHALYGALESSDVTWKIPTQLQMCHQ